MAAPSASSGSVIAPVPSQVSIAPFVSNPSQLQMPLEHVTVQEMHAGTNGRLIIHIQDAHANLSGQQSLSKALDQILTKYDLKLVLVEGSARDSSLDEIRKLAPLKEWKIIARRFLYEGIISGEEYLNLTSEHPMKIIGVEYRDLYDEAVKAYAAIVDRRKDILHYLYQAKVSLDRLKVRMYPRELKDYEAKKGPEDGSGSIDFKTGFVELLKLADAAEFPVSGLAQVEKLRALMEKESLVDFEKAGKEQEAILKGLAVAGADEEVREFTEASRRLRFSQVSQFLLIQKLLQTASDREVSMENFPDLMAYAGYLEKFSDLKMDELMTQLEFLEDKVYEKLLPNDDARKVRAIDRFLGLLGNAYKLQMSSQEFGMFTFNEKDFRTESWLAFMNRQLVDLGFFESLVPYQPYLEEARGDFGRFYRLVGERDIAFVENANRIMAEQNEKAAVLIAGGYHTAHLTELLRKEGTSYIVLTPVVTDTTDHDRYEELLLSHLKDQEKRLASSGAAKKDTGPYRAQNVATTKIPRGLRLTSAADGRLAQSAARLSAFLEAHHVDAARLAAVANELAARPESVRPPASTADGARLADAVLGLLRHPGEKRVLTKEEFRMRVDVMSLMVLQGIYVDPGLKPDASAVDLERSIFRPRPGGTAPNYTNALERSRAAILGRLEGTVALNGNTYQASDIEDFLTDAEAWNAWVMAMPPALRAIGPEGLTAEQVRAQANAAEEWVGRLVGFYEDLTRVQSFRNDHPSLSAGSVLEFMRFSSEPGGVVQQVLNSTVNNPAKINLGESPGGSTDILSRMRPYRPGKIIRDITAQVLAGQSQKIEDALFEDFVVEVMIGVDPLNLRLETELARAYGELFREFQAAAYIGLGAPTRMDDAPAVQQAEKITRLMDALKAANKSRLERLNEVVQFLDSGPASAARMSVEERLSAGFVLTVDQLRLLAKGGEVSEDSISVIRLRLRQAVAERGTPSARANVSFKVLDYIEAVQSKDIGAAQSAMDELVSLLGNSKVAEELIRLASQSAIENFLTADQKNLIFIMLLAKQDLQAAAVAAYQLWTGKKTLPIGAITPGWIVDYQALRDMDIQSFRLVRGLLAALLMRAGLVRSEQLEPTNRAAVELVEAGGQAVLKLAKTGLLDRQPARDTRTEATEAEAAILAAASKIQSNAPAKICFVCTANMNRSAAGHIILEDAARKQGRANLQVVSGGLLTDQLTGYDGKPVEGAPIHADYVEPLRAQGVERSVIGDFRSHQITAEMVRGTDLIVVASPAHKQRLLEMFPELTPVQGRIVLFTQMDPDLARYGDEMPDPQRGDGTVQGGISRADLLSEIKKIADRLLSGPTAGPEAATDRSFPAIPVLFEPATREFKLLTAAWLRWQGSQGTVAEVMTSSGPISANAELQSRILDKLTVRMTLAQFAVQVHQDLLSIPTATYDEVIALAGPAKAGDYAVAKGAILSTLQALSGARLTTSPAEGAAPWLSTIREADRSGLRWPGTPGLRKRFFEQLRAVANDTETGRNAPFKRIGNWQVISVDELLSEVPPSDPAWARLVAYSAAYLRQLHAEGRMFAPSMFESGERILDHVYVDVRSLFDAFREKDPEAPGFVVNTAVWIDREAHFFRTTKSGSRPPFRMFPTVRDPELGVILQRFNEMPIGDASTYRLEQDRKAARRSGEQNLRDEWGSLLDEVRGTASDFGADPEAAAVAFESVYPRPAGGALVMSGARLVTSQAWSLLPAVDGSAFPVGEAAVSGMESFIPAEYLARLRGRTPVGTSDGAGIMAVDPQPLAGTKPVQSVQEGEIAAGTDKFVRSLAKLPELGPVEVVHVFLTDLADAKNLRSDDHARIVSELGAVKGLRIEVVSGVSGKWAGKELRAMDALAAEIARAGDGTIYNLIGSPERIQSMLGLLSENAVKRTVRAPVSVDDAPIADLAGAALLGTMNASFKDAWNRAGGSMTVEETVSKAVQLARNISVARLTPAVQKHAKTLLFSPSEAVFEEDYGKALADAALRPFETLAALITQVASAARMAAIAA